MREFEPSKCESIDDIRGLIGKTKSDLIRACKAAETISDPEQKYKVAYYLLCYWRNCIGKLHANEYEVNSKIANEINEFKQHAAHLINLHKNAFLVLKLIKESSRWSPSSSDVKYHFESSGSNKLTLWDILDCDDDKKYDVIESIRSEIGSASGKAIAITILALEEKRYLKKGVYSLRKIHGIMTDEFGYIGALQGVTKYYNGRGVTISQEEIQSKVNRLP